MTALRTGLGYDIHRFAAGRPLVLGGVEIPSARGLEGHSDADVLCHAIADALLGAAGERDIGHHFPNTDERWRGASSLDLLRDVRSLLAARGARIANVDACLIAEEPKIAPHIAAMKERVADALGIHPSQIGVKATTNERLGALGRAEGIAALATALIEVFPQIPQDSPWPGARLA